jgi:Major Facilitator Superfamily
VTIFFSSLFHDFSLQFCSLTKKLQGTKLTGDNSTAFQPLYGQLAQVFGRRWLLIGAVAVFALGSGISGGATSSSMLLAGRIIQGIGGGGLSLMTQIIISDLVSVRERAKFMSIIFATFTLGTGLGPFIAGALVDHTTWRWVFYINLPIAGVSLVLLYIFLQVHYKKTLTVRQKLTRIDYVGNVLLVMSVSSILIALSWADTKYPWSSWRILVPLLMGFAGTALFHVYEATPWCKEPTVPGHVFSNNRTTTLTLLFSFCQFMLSFWIIYFLPVYFQGVLLMSPERSGVMLLPTVLFSPPVAMASGQLLSRTGRYKPIHLTGLGLLTLGIGLFIHLDQNCSIGEVVGFQLIAGLGMGLIMSTLLPAVQAGLPQKQVASATATWGFVRAYGGIWGVAIPGAVFNSQFQKYLLAQVTDPQVIKALSNGSAYSQVSGSYINSLPSLVRSQVIGVYADAVRMVWIVAVAISGAAFVLCFLEKEIPLRTTVKSDYGLKEKKPRLDEDMAAVVSTSSDK